MGSGAAKECTRIVRQGVDETLPTAPRLLASLRNATIAKTASNTRAVATRRSIQLISQTSVVTSILSRIKIIRFREQSRLLRAESRLVRLLRIVSHTSNLENGKGLCC